jgi:hypothetical protein
MCIRKKLTGSTQTLSFVLPLTLTSFIYVQQITPTLLKISLTMTLKSDALQTYRVGNAVQSTVVPPDLLVQYPQFQLSVFYRGPPENWKIKEINSS